MTTHSIHAVPSLTQDMQAMVIVKREENPEEMRLRLAFTRALISTERTNVPSSCVGRSNL